MTDTLIHYAAMIESMIGVSQPRGVDGASTADGIEQTRAVYHPLKIYAQLMSPDFTPSASLEHCCEDLADHQYSGELPAAMWSALALHVGGKRFDRPEWITKGERAFAELISHQQADGTFLLPDVAASPEARWYDELVLLHAVSSFAVNSGDQSADHAAAKSAMHHLHETQPDHASAQPWGLLAFILHAPPLADQVLHAATMQYPNGITGAPLLLLTDVLYGLRQLQRTTNL